MDQIELDVVGFVQIISKVAAPFQLLEIIPITGVYETFVSGYLYDSENPEEFLLPLNAVEILPIIYI